MAREIELKLAVPAGAHDALAGWLDAHAQPAGSVALANVYYDTPEQALARNRGPCACAATATSGCRR